MDFLPEEQKLLNQAMNFRPGSGMMVVSWSRWIAPIALLLVGVWSFLGEDQTRIPVSWTYLTMGFLMCLNLITIILCEKEKQRYLALLQKLAAAQELKPVTASGG